jgi:hypothetical protein
MAFMVSLFDSKEREESFRQNNSRLDKPFDIDGFYKIPKFADYDAICRIN